MLELGNKPVCESSVFWVSLLLLLHYQFPTRSQLCSWLSCTGKSILCCELVVLTVSVGFMQLENFMVSQAVQCVAARWNKKQFVSQF